MLADFQILETDRLELRALVLSDSDDVFQLRTDKKVNTYIERPFSRKDNSGKEFINRITYSIQNGDVFYWVLALKNNPKLMGTICLWNFNEDKSVAEIGYDLFPKYQSKGFMTEAMSAVLDFGFNHLKCKTIEAFTHRENTGSLSLLSKHGFVKNEEKQDEHNSNNIIYTKTND